MEIAEHNTGIIKLYEIMFRCGGNSSNVSVASFLNFVQLLLKLAANMPRGVWRIAMKTCLMNCNKTQLNFKNVLSCANFSLKSLNECNVRLA